MRRSRDRKSSEAAKTYSGQRNKALGVPMTNIFRIRALQKRAWSLQTAQGQVPNPSTHGHKRTEAETHVEGQKQ